MKKLIHSIFAGGTLLLAIGFSPLAAQGIIGNDSQATITKTTVERVDERQIAHHTNGRPAGYGTKVPDSSSDSDDRSAEPQ